MDGRIRDPAKPSSLRRATYGCDGARDSILFCFPRPPLHSTALKLMLHAKLSSEPSAMLRIVQSGPFRIEPLDVTLD